MTDFVLDINNLVKKKYDQFTYEHNGQKLRLIEKYANFLKQPLTLGMFVPCDADGNVLEEPEHFFAWCQSDHYFNASESATHQCSEFKKAQSKVLFNGFNSELYSKTCKIMFFNNFFMAASVGIRRLNRNRVNIIMDLVPYNIDLSVSF